MQVRLVVLVLAPILSTELALSQNPTARLRQEQPDVPSTLAEIPLSTLVPSEVSASSEPNIHDDSGTRNRNDANTNVELAIQKTHPTPPNDRNREIYYRNKLEFSLDSGWLPINIPFPFDFMLKSEYNTYPLKYTLVPVIVSLRWQLGNLRGPVILRGNWDLEFSGAVIAIPRGPETRYFSYLMGMRRNFVPRNWTVSPYFDWRIGLGTIDAKGPLGIPYAQGQDFTFTLNMGSGLRYNFSPHFAITLGLNWMHISNANLSEGSPPNWGYRNYGINVYGPIVGVDIQLHRHRSHSE